MAEKITCINGNVLKWARIQCGDLQLKEISEMLPRIETWESGDDFPTYAQLEKLADAYRKPLAIFFFPQPPEDVSYKAGFRTTSESEIMSLSHKVTRVINEALVMQINLHELVENPMDVRKVLHNRLRNTRNADLISKTRKYLGITINQQIKTATAKEMFEKWRDAFYEQGIFVFKEAFYDESISGFCIYDEQFPIIYINNSMSHTRQIFTLFHELYHLIHETCGIDRLNDNNHNDGLLTSEQYDIEKMCNTFACRFLVPTHNLENIIGNIVISYNDICKLANKFCVSREAIILRLIELQRVDWNFYHNNIGDIRSEFMRKKPNKKGGSHYNSLISYLGKKYLNIAFSAYRNNRIDAFELASYTKTKVSNLTALEQAWGWKV